jgi:hypothetical protein
MLMTSWLVQSGGHGSVTILGRSGRSRQVDAASIRGGSAVVAIARCDVGASEDVRGVASSSTSKQVVSVMHAGGVLADAMVGNQSAGSFTSVLAPKVGSAASPQLDFDLTPDWDPDLTPD